MSAAALPTVLAVEHIRNHFGAGICPILDCVATTRAAALVCRDAPPELRRVAAWGPWDPPSPKHILAEVVPDLMRLASLGNYVQLYTLGAKFRVLPSGLTRC